MENDNRLSLIVFFSVDEKCLSVRESLNTLRLAIVEDKGIKC